MDNSNAQCVEIYVNILSEYLINAFIFFYTISKYISFFHGNRTSFNVLKRKEIALNFGLKIKTKSQIQYLIV